MVLSVKQKMEFLFSMLCFLGMVSISLSLPVYSQTKKSTSTARKTSTSTARKASTSAARKTSTSTARKATSSAVRKTSTSSSSSRKRTLASTSRVRSASSNSRIRTKSRTPVGNRVSFLNQLDDSVSTSELTCINSYVECMDEQISDIISKYSFLEDDEALNEALDTGQAFRCIFYDTSSTSLKSNPSSIVDDDKTVCFGLTADTCYSQRGVNELYNAYNYYCSINRSLKNNIGRKVNQCDLDTASSFATKYSSAYYNEVLDRIEGDGLQMINLESSTIYKNLISQLNLTNESDYVMDSDISSQIFNQLNLEQETELFSINVVPPVGVATFLPSVQFRTASNKCFSTETTSITSSTKNAQAVADQNERINLFKQNNCASLKSNLERYYLTGKWETEGSSVDEEGNIITSSGEDISSDFFSAKESCSLYEQALISVRDKKYGEFDNQMQNWIEDNIAKMIQKKIKSTSSLAQAENSLRDLDASISLENEKTEAQLEYNKAQAENQIKAAQNSYNLALSEASIKQVEAQKSLAQTYAKTFSTKALSACMDMVKKSYNSICSSDGSKCFAKDSKLTSTYYNWIADIKKKSIKISKKGSIIQSISSNFNNYIPSKTSSADNNKKEGYYQISCVELENFNNKQAFFSTLPASLEANYGASVRDAVEEDLQKTFP